MDESTSKEMQIKRAKKMAEKAIDHHDEKTRKDVKVGDIISQGAEAKISITLFDGEMCVVKERFVKTYRHPDLDAQLTRERMRTESKTATRCQMAGITVPRILFMDLNDHKMYMEYFKKSITAKAYLNEKLPKIADSRKRRIQLEGLACRIGTNIGTMHDNNIIHGDLTTSNMLLAPNDTASQSEDNYEDYKLVMIDFGLSSHNQNDENKGVDLYVLERALLSTHAAIPELFDLILNAYKTINKVKSSEVIAKFEIVRARGRKRTMIG